MGCVVGGLFLLLQRDVLIVRWALTNASKISLDQSKSVSRKDINCFYWKDGVMNRESCSLLHEVDNHAENLKNLVARWLMVNQDEYVVDRGVSVLYATLSSFNDEAFLTFTHSFLSKEFSLFQKLHIVESLLKTVRESMTCVRSVVFIVVEKPMPDDHLDFTSSWPIDGF